MGLLQGKVAIVSGVGPGLGRSTALALAEQGAAVALAARSSTVIDEVAAEIRGAGGRCFPVVTDLTVPAQAGALVAAVRDEFGQVDVLVNNAFDTKADYTPLADAELDRWHDTMQIMYWGTVATTQAVIKHMTERGSGRIIMIGSLATYRPQPTWGAYIGPKAALLGLVRLLATELGPAGIRVNCVQPAYIFGPTVEKFLHEQAAARGVDYDTVYEEAARDTALGYLAPSDEVAGSVVFFASDLSAPVTGQILNVNAGSWMN